MKTEHRITIAASLALLLCGIGFGLSNSAQGQTQHTNAHRTPTQSEEVNNLAAKVNQLENRVVGLSNSLAIQQNTIKDMRRLLSDQEHRTAAVEVALTQHGFMHKH